MRNKLTITLATANEGKLLEFRELLPDINLVAPDGPLPEETGASYLENALIKARGACIQTGGYVLADDSGLSIDRLGGAPGLYSSRFAGAGASYDEKISRIWELLADVPPAEWTASFHCALAFIQPDRTEHTFEGVVRGLILPEKRGENGFGFDPVFYVPSLGKTTAELDPALKNEISHRGLAVKKLRVFLAALKREGSDG